MTATDIAGLFSALPDADLAAGDETRAYAVDGLCPSVVVRARDAAGVSAALATAARHGLAVIPWGGGTAIELGNIPTRYDVALDLRGLGRVLEYRPRDLTVTVQAGITLAALQRLLDADGQMVALDPPLPERATVGGTVAADCTGPRRHRYGTARDLVIGVQAALADGTPVKSGGRVVKNVAGYDLNKLFVGSHGTLAVITAVTFRLWPAPRERCAVAAAFDTVEKAHAAAMRVRNSTLAPLSLDLLNAEAARLLPAGAAHGAASHWVLFAELGGSTAELRRTRAELERIAGAAGSSATDVLEGDEAERARVRLRDAAALDPVPSLVVALDVLPSQVADVCRALAQTGAPRPRIIARMGSGQVRCLWHDGALNEVEQLPGRLRALAGPPGGTVVVERASVALKRTLDVWGIAGPDVTIMRRIKQQFDPAGILSPGRGPADGRDPDGRRA
jgi:glycolate oxidase FAD binding subunit